MFIYFEFEQEYRKKIADCFEVNVDELDEFFSDLESEVGWYIALGGLRNSDLSAKEALAYLEELSQESLVLLERFENMPKNILGWLVESAPLGVNHREPFKKILPLLRQIIRFISDATDNADPEEDLSQANSMDLIKRLKRCHDDHSHRPIDIQTKLFKRYVEIVFDAIGLDDDPQQVIQKTLDYKRESAAIAAKNAMSLRKNNKPLGGIELKPMQHTAK